MERTLICIRLQKIPIPQKPPKCSSTLVFHDTTQWHGIGSILSWWKATVNRDSAVSRTHFRCALMREPLFAQLVPAPREPDAAVTYWATIFTFHFSTTRSGRKLSGRYCDEITMSFSLSKELQSAAMKEAGLMGEMITCHGYKNGWSSEDSLRGNWREMEFFFFLWNTFKIAQPIFYFWNEVLGEQFNGLTVSGSPWSLLKDWCEIGTCRPCCEKHHCKEEYWTS